MQQQQEARVLAGRYELGVVLGEGGMARVYRGLDRRLRRQVAVKVLASPFDRDEAFIERFRREARAAAGLSHPNVVAVFDSGSDDGTHFIVTELVEGETLADRIGREGALPSHEGVAIGAAVARALAAAHGRGVVHRDVKPGNVMLVGDGGVKVVDFGIARATSSDTIMQTGPLMGTMAYLSPEQVSGERGDERSDIYALGVRAVRDVDRAAAVPSRQAGGDDVPARERGARAPVHAGGDPGRARGDHPSSAGEAAEEAVRIGG